MASSRVSKIKRPVGRPRTCLSYEAARTIVRAEMLKSSVEYRKWWMHNKPSTIPKNPNRAYAKVWIGWGDFLGSDNPFPCVRKSFRTYKESRAWAHSLGLKNKAAWIDFCKREDFPLDVPKRPDFYYNKSKEWITWKDFLGYSTADRVAALDEVDHIIYVIKYPELPTNVYTIGVTNEGIPGLIDKMERYGFSVLGAFYHDKTSDWFAPIARMTSKYHVGDRNFICNNVNLVLEYLSLSYRSVT